MQDNLSSVSDACTTLHTVLGSGTAADKLKASSGPSGILLYIAAEPLSIRYNPMMCLVAIMYCDKTSA